MFGHVNRALARIDNRSWASLARNGRRQQTTPQLVP